MKTRCKLGDRCIIVGEIPGCEENIGAILTVSNFIDDEIAWEFEAASRPLKMHGPGGIDDIEYLTSSRESKEYVDCDVYIYDKHLVPIQEEKEIKCTSVYVKDLV